MAGGRPKKYTNAYVGVKFVTNVVSWIESYYHRFKVFPNDALLMTQFGIDRERLDALQRSKLYKDALYERGIEKRKRLSVEQQACISVMTNFADQRSTDVKLASIGVTPEMYQGWLAHRDFQLELTARADEILPNLNADAMASFAKQVQKGNMTAIKLYFEMTGKAQSQEQVNIRMMLTKTLEAIQSHVKDPAILLALTKDLLGESATVADIPVQAQFELESNDK